MRFGVLGPLAVWTSAGGPVRIPEVKVRALLAELLINTGRVVPADRLIDDLWGENLPANPSGALQTRVSQLRRALEDAEPGSKRLVVSRPPGYLLDAGADAVDTGRFQALITQGRTAGTPQARTALLGEALALWRGPPLIDFADEEFARAEINRLAELRLTALEEQAEARLELGEHAMLADELGDLVTRHPLRERLRAAHLRALYRAGRQNEALDGFRDLRERLAEELGVDPSRELAALHQSILEQDAALGALPVPAPPPSNLPTPLGDLIGRSAEVDAVGELLGRDRLVTLTGPGGVGKTRLAVEAARRLTGTFPDGVWLVELGPLPEAVRPAEVAELIAAALRVRDEATAGLPGSLAEALRGKRLLLVLDNCEHVVAPVAELTSTLLRAAPGLHVLATSQRPLGVAGELLRNVPPLEETSAVRLFAARAAAGAPGFTLNEGNAEAVAAICRRLDGIPLALELAATRVRALGVPELAVRLDDRFRVLAAGHSDAPARQRTLRAMIDWSWELLTGAEQTVLRRLAVHADGCTLHAAEQVCGDGDRRLDTADVVDVLAGLVDRSLVVVGDGPRYRLLESVAAYCHERLREAGEQEEIEHRHRRYYTELAATADPHLRGPAQQEWLRRLDAETANLRAALDSAVRHGGALPLACSLAWYWVLRGRLGEGLRSLTSALKAGGSEDAAGTALAWRAAFHLRIGESPDPADLDPPEARPGDLAGDLVALAGRARAEWFLAFSRLGVGELPSGEDLAGRALAGFRAIGDQWGTAAALSTQAMHALIRSDLAGLKAAGEQSMALFTELGDRWGRLHATSPLGTYAEITGDYPEAARLHREGLRMAEELGLWTSVCDKLSALGRIALLTGDYPQADDLHDRARRRAAEQGYTVGEEFAELGLALSARRQGRLDEAEALLRRWLDFNRRLDSDLALSLILDELGFVAEQRGDAEAARTLHLEGLMAARGAGDPRAVALAAEGLAGSSALAGDHERAARLLGTAAAIRESVSAPLPLGERGDVERITATSTAALGTEAFDIEYEHGRLGNDPEAHLK